MKLIDIKQHIINDSILNDDVITNINYNFDDNTIIIDVNSNGNKIIIECKDIVIKDIIDKKDIIKNAINESLILEYIKQLINNNDDIFIILEKYKHNNYYDIIEICIYKNKRIYDNIYIHTNYFLDIDNHKKYFRKKLFNDFIECHQYASERKKELFNKIFLSKDSINNMIDIVKLLDSNININEKIKIEL